MHKKIIDHPELKLIGLKTRTNNKNEFNPETSKIGSLINEYFTKNVADKIPNRKNPGIRIAAYSNYESDEHEDYDYFFGEEVSSLENIPKDLSSLVIPSGKYLKVTSDPGKMPNTVINTWEKIWTMTKNNELGGQRSYKSDFEVYDQRADDPNNAIVDIYLGFR